MPAQFGLQLPSFSFPTRADENVFDVGREITQTAEELGFDSVWLMDHLFQIPVVAAETDPLPECWSALAALAACTTPVELGHLVLGLGFRNPALLAKIADTVDEISGGRLILGVGAGYHELEYRAFGFPYDHRYSRFEEALHIVHGLLRNGEIEFVGKYSQARDCVLRPRGPRPEGPPIMIGTTGHNEEELAVLHEAATNIPIVFAPNFSVGVNTLFWLTRHAARILGNERFDIEVTEMHHRHKIDAPSGTARRLLEILNEETKTSYQDNVTHGRVGITGRSEERRVGKSVDLGGPRTIKKKKPPPPPPPPSSR